jgi:hypothetical protein
MGHEPYGGPAVRIALLVEGNTEKAFHPVLVAFLRERLGHGMPRIKPITQDGRIPKGDKLKRIVDNLLTGQDPYDAVIALTDVYTGTGDFTDAADAKAKMKGWVGNNPRFYPHAAQHDFEAWLLPFWPTIQRLAGHNKSAPSGPPEVVNHDNPPSRRIQELFRIGTCSHDYVKPRDGLRILREPGNRLEAAAEACPELKAFLDTILNLCGVAPLP